MKILLIVLAALTLLVLSVFVIGSLLPKRHVVSRAASFQAAPEKLFPLIVGPQNWRPDVLGCEAVADSSGREFQRETTRNGNVITYELLERVPPTSVTRRIATENLPYSGSWSFSIQPGNGGSVVRITENGEVSNPVIRFVSMFLDHTRSLDAYLQALGRASGQQVEIHN